jgi:hypothetical protein
MSRHSHPAHSSALAFAVLITGYLAPEPAIAAQEKPQVQAGDKGAVSLRWRFAAGRPFYQVVTLETAQRYLTNGGSVTKTECRLSYVFWCRWTPVEQRGGKWILRQDVLGAKVDVEYAGIGIHYDSRQKKSLDESGKELDTVRGASFLLTLAPDGHVEQIEGFDRWMRQAKEKLRGKVALLLDWLFPEALFRRSAEATFAPGPADRVRVAPGASWSRASLLYELPWGKTTLISRYTYQGKQDGHDRATLADTVKHEPPAPQQGVVINNLKASSKGSSGALRFDRTRGRLATFGKDVQVEINAALVVNGINSNLKLVCRQQMAIKITDTNPLR